MVKSFAPRKTKRERARSVVSNVTNSEKIQKIFRSNDERLLSGAKLSDVMLEKISVKAQVRTKFDDASLRELAKNIEANGLIQPLVIHREGSSFVLLCGERRYRAMNLIKKESAPCYILDGKSREELLAIQFSENSSREDLHYIDKADGIYNYHKVTKSSERKIQKDLGISKTEVHRSLLLGKLPNDLKEAAKIHNIEKYVLLEYDAIPNVDRSKKKIKRGIIEGKIVKRLHLKKFLSSGVLENKVGKYSKSGKKSSSRKGAAAVKKDLNLPRGLSARAFIKAMSNKSENYKLDTKTRKAVEKLIKETSELIGS